MQQIGSGTSPDSKYIQIKHLKGSHPAFEGSNGLAAVVQMLDSAIQWIINS